MQKKKILDYLSLANYIADVSAIETIKLYKSSKIAFSDKKENINQVVTTSDLKIEKMARNIIKSKFPEHNIIGEEFEEIDNKSDYTWIIDPIDGTKALIAGIPVFTFLISLKYKNKFLLGLVDQPILKERYWNLNNQAYLNNKLIKVKKYNDVSKSVVAITDPLMFKNYDKLCNTLFNKFSFVRWGTDAIGYMRCAEGTIDAVIERNIKIWDIAAVIPILRSAGGIITTWNNKIPGTNDTVIACNDKKIHKLLVNTLQKFI